MTVFVQQSAKAREALSQYIARHPVSLIYIPAQGKIIYQAKYNQYKPSAILRMWREHQAPQRGEIHRPPHRAHSGQAQESDPVLRHLFQGPVDRFAKEVKGKARMDGNLDKFGFSMKRSEYPASGAAEPSGDPVETITRQQAKSAWERMIRKVYEADAYPGGDHQPAEDSENCGASTAQQGTSF